MKRTSAALFFFAFLLAVFLASFQEAPGYMDADYYFLGSRNLVQGNGFQENVLWNYLDDPTALPHPSHAYWLPGTSLLGAAALWLNPIGGFNQAQWAFILVASLVPLLTHRLALQIYRHQPHGRQEKSALLAGSLALFPGYYAGFLTTTDSFGLYMVLGALFFIAFLADIKTTYKAAFLGGIAGLMHLTRTDGFIWLIVAAWVTWNKDDRRAIWLVGIAYLAVMSPWFVRNGQAFGSILAPGGTRALWWTHYDDLFAFPAGILTPARWIESGPTAILQARLSAAWSNLSSLVAVGGMIFLAPLIVFGFWRRRADKVVQAGALGWGLVFGLMTILFPFAGARGGYFHAGAALQPLFWALVPEGFESFLDWGRRKRSWRVGEARSVFGAGLVVLAAIVTSFLVWIRIIGPSFQFDAEAPAYVQAENFLIENGALSGEIVMVNNPPGYNLISARPAIVIPGGGLVPILEAGSQFDADFLLLGAQQGFPEIYDHPVGHPGLNYLGEVDGLKIFRLKEQP